MSTARDIEDNKETFIKYIRDIDAEGAGYLPRCSRFMDEHYSAFSMNDGTDKNLLMWTVKFNISSITVKFFDLLHKKGLDHLLSKIDRNGNSVLDYAAIYDNVEFIKAAKERSDLNYDSRCLILAIKNGSLNFLKEALSENEFPYESIIQAVRISCNLNYKMAYEILQKKYVEILEIKRSEYRQKYPLLGCVLLPLSLCHDFLVNTMYSSNDFYNVVKGLINIIFDYVVDKVHKSINCLFYKCKLDFLYSTIIPESCRYKIKNFYISIKEYLSLFLIIPNPTLEEYKPPSIKQKDESNRFTIPVEVNQISLSESAEDALSIIGESVAENTNSMYNCVLSVRSQRSARAVNASTSRLTQCLPAFPPENDTTTASDSLNGTSSSLSSQQSFVGSDLRNNGSNKRAYDS